MGLTMNAVGIGLPVCRWSHPVVVRIETRSEEEALAMHRPGETDRVYGRGWVLGYQLCAGTSIRFVDETLQAAVFNNTSVPPEQ